MNIYFLSSSPPSSPPSSSLKSHRFNPEGRRRLALMLLMVAALFLLSWLPYTIYNLCLDFFVFTGDPVTSVTFAYVVLVIGHSHCAQNPILYCILNRPFKRRLAKMFGCRRTTFSLTHTGECSTKQVGGC